MGEYNPEYCVYKPTQSGKGGAIRWTLDVAKEAVFVEAAQQEAERRFDWENKLVMKWAVSDIGEVLAVIEKRADAVELFHKSPSGIGTFAMKFQRDKKPSNYFIKFSRQEADSKEKRAVGIPLSQAEAATLCVLLRAAIVWILKW